MRRKKYILNSNPELNTALVNNLCAGLITCMLDELKIVQEHIEKNGYDHSDTIEVLDTFFWRFESRAERFVKEEDLSE